MGEGDLSRGLAEQKKINILIKGATGLKETDDALVSVFSLSFSLISLISLSLSLSLSLSHIRPHLLG